MKKLLFLFSFLLIFISLFSQEWDNVYVLYGKNKNIYLYSLSNKRVLRNILSSSEIKEIKDISPDYFFVKTAVNSYLINKNDFSVVGIEYNNCKYGYDKYYVYGDNGLCMFFPAKMVTTSIFPYKVEDIFIDKYQISGWYKNKIYVYADRMIDSIVAENDVKKSMFFTGNPRLIFIDKTGKTELWGVFPLLKIFVFPGRYYNFAINGDRYVVLYKKNTMSLWNRRSFVHLRDTVLTVDINDIKVKNRRLYVLTDTTLFIMDDTFYVRKEINVGNSILNLQWGPDNIIAISTPDSLIIYNAMTDSSLSIPIDSSYYWAISSQRLDIEGDRPISLDDTHIVRKEEKKKEDKVTGFAIQVSATSSLNGVDNLTRKFLKTGIPVYYKEYVNDKGRTIYRIRVGLFDSKETAEIFKNYITEKFPEYSSLWYSQDTVSVSVLKQFNKNYVILDSKNIYILNYNRGLFSLEFGYSTSDGIIPGSLKINKNEIRCKLIGEEELSIYRDKDGWRSEIIKPSLKDSIN